MNLTANIRTDALIVVESETKGQVFTCSESLSFWGGVDPDTGRLLTHIIQIMELPSLEKLF